MNKGIALNYIIALVIAVTGVITFISLITGSLHGTTTAIYCNTYVKLVNMVPSSEGPLIPEVCREKGPVHSESLEGSDNKKVSRKLLSYIISCWNNVDISHIEGNYTCYQLRLSGNIDDVTEENVSALLIIEDHCESIENSDYGCGAKDQIIWDVSGDVLNTQKILLIMYDGEKEAIKVTG
ncbi:MAG: hypothetical protein KAU95_01505 [Candidatus Aenigmarchaeota archaeon]|nr:hypothetical protein [Candidatus Aenigmarchaeota archaeon]